MGIYIWGGGSGEIEKEIETNFSKELNPNKPLLYIPFTRNPPYEDSINKISRKFTEQGITIESLESIEDLRTIDLKTFSGIYVGGGSSYKIITDFRNTNFDKRLIEFLLEGGKYFGGSAGAIILGKHLKTSREKPRENFENFGGLGQIGEYAISCHYGENREDIIRAFIKETGISVLALSEKTGAKISRNIINIIGLESAVIFNSYGKKVIQPSNKIPL